MTSRLLNTYPLTDPYLQRSQTRLKVIHRNDGVPLNVTFKACASLLHPNQLHEFIPPFPQYFPDFAGCCVVLFVKGRRTLERSQRNGLLFFSLVSLD